jgi:hypothetical protein
LPRVWSKVGGRSTQALTIASEIADALDKAHRRGPSSTDYAVSHDGQRFLVNTLAEQPTRPSLTVILNWPGGQS